MLFTTFGQGWLFLIILELGLLCALVDSLVVFFPKWLKSRKKLSKIDKNAEKIVKNREKIEFLAPTQPKQKTKTPRKFSFKSPIFLTIIMVLKVFICGAIIYLATLWLNYGEIRAYLILAFVAGFCLERTILVKWVQKWRNYAIIKANKR